MLHDHANVILLIDSHFFKSTSIIMMKISQRKYYFATGIITLQLFLLFNCGSSERKPDEELIKNTALSLSNVAPPRFEALNFEISNEFIKVINDETYYVYETVFKVKDTVNGNVLDGAVTQTPDGIFYRTFALVKRGKKWYPIQ